MFETPHVTHMSISPLPELQRPWSIAVRTAHQKLHQIYQTGSSYVNSGSVKANRLQQYGQAIVADTYPLLLLLSETAEAESLPLEWIENVATEFTALLSLVNETWMLAKDEYVKSKIPRINLKCDNLDQLLMLLFHNISIWQEQENVADLGSMLTPMSFMRCFKKEDAYPQQFWQAFWASIKKRYRHGKKTWALIHASIILVTMILMT